jgi:hypothetical protein
MVAAAIIGGAALSAGSSLLGGSQAAGASNKAAGNNRLQYLQTRADLDPFATAGRVVVPDLVALAQSGQFGGGPNYLSQAAGMQPGQMTQAELEQTPGYQFNLSQGLKSVQSAAAARGLGVSGASLKGAATYATGLADSTYQNQFNNAQTRFQNSLNLNTAQQGNLTNQYNRLSDVAKIGSGAASQTGTIGASLTNQAGQFLQQGGLAQAAGTAGVGNAVTGGINNFLANQFLQQAVGGGGTQGFVDNTSTF